jgi:hypothetical protein
VDRHRIEAGLRAGTIAFFQRGCDPRYRLDSRWFSGLAGARRGINLLGKKLPESKKENHL